MMNNTSDQDQASSSARASPAMRRQGRPTSPQQESQQQQQHQQTHHQYPAGSIHHRMSPPASSLPASLQHAPSAHNGSDIQELSHAHLSPSQPHYNVQQHEQQYSYTSDPSFDSEEERREATMSSHSHSPLANSSSSGFLASEGNVSFARCDFFLAFEGKEKKAHR